MLVNIERERGQLGTDKRPLAAYCDHAVSEESRIVVPLSDALPKLKTRNSKLAAIFEFRISILTGSSLVTSEHRRGGSKT